MPRENIAQLVDLGSFQEYWPLIVAKQHQRHDIETLRKNSPADGVVAGTASINGKYFDDQNSRALVVSYDYTVLAGTQGRRNHYKQDRLYDLANRFRLPIVLFSEGGGGRPGDDDTGPRVAFDTHTFTQFSKLSGLVPLIGVNNGRCFAGNTALLACCDIIIATEGSTIAMGVSMDHISAVIMALICGWLWEKFNTPTPIYQIGAILTLISLAVSQMVRVPQQQE